MISPRRWSFGLRTMLLGVALVCVPLAAWIGYQLSWIRERHAAIEAAESHVSGIDPFSGEDMAAAPGLLWLFGEKGVLSIVHSVGGPKEFEHERQRLKRLFPEATTIEIIDGSRPLEDSG